MQEKKKTIQENLLQFLTDYNKHKTIYTKMELLKKVLNTTFKGSGMDKLLIKKFEIIKKLAQGKQNAKDKQWEKSSEDQMLRDIKRTLWKERNPQSKDKSKQGIAEGKDKLLERILNQVIKNLKNIEVKYFQGMNFVCARLIEKFIDGDRKSEIDSHTAEVKLDEQDEKKIVDIMTKIFFMFDKFVTELDEQKSVLKDTMAAKTSNLINKVFGKIKPDCYLKDKENVTDILNAAIFGMINSPLGSPYVAEEDKKQIFYVLIAFSQRLELDDDEQMKEIVCEYCNFAMEKFIKSDETIKKLYQQLVSEYVAKKDDSKVKKEFFKSIKNFKN